MGMSFSVPEALVPAAPEGALMERFAEEASLQTPMDPLQRLDQSMEQTSDWVRLREILERSSPFVRNTICNALQYEMARSFQNVAQQLQAVQDIVAEMQRIMDSEEAVALGHLMRDIHPSNIRALQREADGIEEDITALRSALERGDFQSLQLRASRVGNKVRRFRDKYAELRPKLERLKSAVEKIADMCAAEARQSEDLITETEQKKESWWRLLENATNVVALVSGIAVFGSAGCLVVSVYAKSQALNVATAALASAKTAAAKAAATASDASAKATALTAAKATAAAEAKAAAAAAAEAAAAAAPTAAATAAAPAAGAEGAVAIGAGVAASGAAGAIGLGAPAATFLGSELLGSWAVSMGLMATPAAPLGAVLGVGAAVAAGVELMWSTAATATTVSATTAATSSAATSAAATTAAASTAAAKAASAASAAAAAAVQAATTAAANSVQAASAVTAAQTTVTSIQAAQAALWTSSRACFLYAGSLLLALALLGYVGRDLVKKLLGQLWAAEIEEHKRSKDAFQHMEQVVRLAAAKLGPVCAKNEALENCLDLVVEAAEELTAGAEDALVSTSHDMEHDRLHTLVEHLSSVYAQVPAAFAELSSSLRDLEPSLQHVGQIALHPAAAFDDRGESRLALSYAGHDADPTQGQSLDIEVDPHPQPENHLPENVFNMKVDQDWVLIQIQSRLLSLSPSASDCLPRNTYILVPVEEAARLGVLRAAGPNGNHVIQVENQGQSPRLLRSFRFAGSPVQHTLTGDHPLRVMASGNWIQEPASRLRVGDVVNTSNGRQEIESVNPPRASAEEVFSLDVKDGGEVYVFTPAHIGDDQLSWSGVAVLGSIQKTQRSRSTPPGYPGDPPSEGSLKCKRNARCSNICRNFKRGKCEEGTDCRFCHFSHPEEPKRQPRGPRDSSKNKTRSKSGSSQSASSQSGSGQSSTDALALDAMD